MRKRNAFGNCWRKARDRFNVIRSRTSCLIPASAESSGLAVRFSLAWLGWLFATFAAAERGGLYISGTNFTFQEAVERGVAMNPNSTRFYVLAVGDAVRGLSVVAPPELVEIRNRGAAAGALYLVCQRDIERGDFSLLDLVPG